MVIQEARRYLGELERRDHSARPATPQQEFDLAPAPDASETAVLAEIAQIDPEGLSPRDALSVLFGLKERLKNDR